MSKFTFIKATKEQSKLRLAVFGPSGSGKTFTSLRLAAGLGGKIAVIDTERGSASKYSDRFEFDVLNLGIDQRDIDTYCAAISAAQAAGYAILIIDSMTHAWHELLGEVDRLARVKYRGNTWSAWSEGTPKQRKLVDSILNYDGHIIATMRTKTEWTTEKTGDGKTRPVRVGLAPEQGKGIEYEFDLLIELSIDHIANVIKDRTGRYQDNIIECPGEDLGHDLAAWLREGTVPRPKLSGIDWDKFNPDPPDWAEWDNKQWPSLWGEAVNRLLYNHRSHVKNTLKKVFNGNNADLTYASAWVGLIDHQQSKRDADVQAALEVAAEAGDG